MKLKQIILTTAALALGIGFASAKPLKAYILVGQSNMQGHAVKEVMAGMAADPISKPLYDKIMDEHGNFRVFEDVQVTAISGNMDSPVAKAGALTFGFGANLSSQANVTGKHAMKFGPELGFGVTMREHLKEPFLIIKAAWGGKSLRKDFLSPSGAQLLGGEATTGTHYQKMLDHVQNVLADPSKHFPGYDPQQGIEIAGFVWFQGFNDMVAEKEPIYQPTETRPAFAMYGDLLACFIRDVRKDFKTPDMPFVIGVIGTGGKPDQKHPFREAMAAPAAMPEFKGNVVAVHTAEYFDEKLGELDDRSWRWQRPAWDPENKYADLRAKLQPLQEQLNAAKKIEDQAERNTKTKEIQSKMQEITYTKEDLEYLKMNKSNQGYHYLGSAKMLARFGEAFAKAMITMEKQ
jgi:alpha-galactosidase